MPISVDDLLKTMGENKGQQNWANFIGGFLQGYMDEDAKLAKERADKDDKDLLRAQLGLAAATFQREYLGPGEEMPDVVKKALGNLPALRSGAPEGGLRSEKAELAAQKAYNTWLLGQGRLGVSQDTLELKKQMYGQDIIEYTDKKIQWGKKFEADKNYRNEIILLRKEALKRVNARFTAGEQNRIIQQTKTILATLNPIADRYLSIEPQNEAKAVALISTDDAGERDKLLAGWDKDPTVSQTDHMKLWGVNKLLSANPEAQKSISASWSGIPAAGVWSAPKPKTTIPRAGLALDKQVRKAWSENRGTLSEFIAALTAVQNDATTTSAAKTLASQYIKHLMAYYYGK